MKEAFRPSMAWLHTWVGLLAGWVLYFMFVTGTLGYVDTEIDRWMHPELPAARLPISQDGALAQARTFLDTHASDARRWTISLPIDRNEPYLHVSWRGADPGEAYLDPDTGQRLVTRETGGGQWLYQLHWRLHYLPGKVAEWIVGFATLTLFVALVTGIVAHRRLFADFFTFRPHKGQRSWLDAHNLASVVTLPFQLMISYSGLVFVMFSFTPLIVAVWYGPGDRGHRAFLEEVFPPLAPAMAAGQVAALVRLEDVVADARRRQDGAPVASVEVQNPGDSNARIVVAGSFATGPVRTADIRVYDGSSGELLLHRSAAQSRTKDFRDLMLGLHEGMFAGALLRALYVLSGLVGCAMIASGLVLWTVKRRQRTERGRAHVHSGLRVVERLNVAVVLGLPLAIGAYFWANRMVPADVVTRAAWETHLMFAMWAATFVHAALRPSARHAWREQSAALAFVYAMLPLLNAVTSHHSLARSLSAGDWVMAGFDLSAVALATIFAGGACILARRPREAPA